MFWEAITEIIRSKDAKQLDSQSGAGSRMIAEREREKNVGRESFIYFFWGDVWNRSADP